MYGKLNNGILEIFHEKSLRQNGRVYVNPSENILTAAGYKPVIETEPPEERERYYLMPSYEETKKQIKQVWDYVKIPENEDELI